MLLTMILFQPALLKTSMSIGKAITKFCCLQCHETLLEVPMWKETTRTHSSDDQTLCIVIRQDKLWLNEIMVWILLAKDWNMYKHQRASPLPQILKCAFGYSSQAYNQCSALGSKTIKRLAIKFSIHLIMGHFLNFTL